jgi:3-phenylpropionate/cinnamic acid dioxygenase small subunit
MNRKMHWVFAALAAAGLAGCGVDAATQKAQAALQQQLQQAQDREDIELLMWRYARALDTTDAEAYAALYTADGQFGTGDAAVKGHEALKQMVLDVRKRREERIAKGEPAPGTMHATADHVIEFHDADHATFHSYWATFFPGQGAERPTQVAAVGRGADQLVRVDGKWLIQVRNVRADIGTADGG